MSPMSPISFIPSPGRPPVLGQEKAGGRHAEGLPERKDKDSLGSSPDAAAEGVRIAIPRLPVKYVKASNQLIVVIGNIMICAFKCVLP